MKALIKSRIALVLGTVALAASTIFSPGWAATRKLGEIAQAEPFTGAIPYGFMLVRRGGGPGSHGPEFHRRYKMWKSLPPEKKRLLRERMKEWERMSPEDRALIRKRFEQWKRLPPEDRKWLLRKLRNWNNLSPREKEFIREKFLRD